jgi:hypothetical protein
VLESLDDIDTHGVMIITPAERRPAVRQEAEGAFVVPMQSTMRRTVALLEVALGIRAERLGEDAGRE